MVALDPERIREVTDECYVDIYLSGGLSYGWWPWVMEHVEGASSDYVSRCDSYILDSSYRNSSIGNEDVFDRADELGAEMVVLADIPGDMEGTIASVLDGLDLLDDHPCDAEPILPLQPPHDECYRELEGLADRYAIGGVVNAGTRKQIEAARAVRNASGSDIWLHGLGYGLETPRNRYGPKTLVYTLNENPHLLDSLDYSTPAQIALKQPHTAGQHRSLPIAAYSGYVLLEVARLLSRKTNLASQTVHKPLSW